MGVNDNPENKKLKEWNRLNIGVSAVAGITAAKGKVIWGLLEHVVELRKVSVDSEFDCTDEYLFGFRIPCGDGTDQYDSSIVDIDFDMSKFVTDVGSSLLYGSIAFIVLTALKPWRYPTRGSRVTPGTYWYTL